MFLFAFFDAVVVRFLYIVGALKLGEWEKKGKNRDKICNVGYFKRNEEKIFASIVKFNACLT